MAIKNQTTVVKGGVVTLDIFLYANSTSPLTDPDSTPTYIIYNPLGTSVASGLGTKISTGHYSAQYVVPITAQSSNTWRISWSARINGITVPDTEEYFIVTDNVQAYVPGSIIIDDYSLNQIKSVIGFPRVDKIIFTDPEIKDLIIERVLRIYFNKFPKVVQVQQAVYEGVTIPFLDDDTFGVVNLGIVGKGGQGGTSNNFWDIIRWQIYTGYSMTGQYGIPRFNPSGMNDLFFNRSNQLNTVQNKLTTQDVRVDVVNRNIKVYTDIASYLLIHWAKFSRDFADVRREYQPDVIQLCQAKLLDLTAKTIGMIEDSDLSVRFNVDAMKAEGQALEQQITEKWQNIFGVPLIYRST